MAKKSETTAKAVVKPSRGKTGDSCKSYMYIRTALDSVQITAIKYYVAGKDAVEKKRRADQIGVIVKHAIEEINRLQGMSVNCPPDEHECNGFCVPYNCP